MNESTPASWQVEVFCMRGFRRLVRISRAPGIAQLLEVGYGLFAKNRLRLTGRCEADVCVRA